MSPQGNTFLASRTITLLTFLTIFFILTFFNKKLLTLAIKLSILCAHMPIIKSAIKRAKQNSVRQKRLQPYKSHMKTMMKKFVTFVEEKDEKKAIALMPSVYKSIDTAAKKKIINPKTAARRKSKMARMLSKPDTAKKKTTAKKETKADAAK